MLELFGKKQKAWSRIVPDLWNCGCDPLIINLIPQWRPLHGTLKWPNPRLKHVFWAVFHIRGKGWYDNIILYTWFVNRVSQNSVINQHVLYSKGCLGVKSTFFRHIQIHIVYISYSIPITSRSPLYPTCVGSIPIKQKNNQLFACSFCTFSARLRSSWSENGGYRKGC